MSKDRAQLLAANCTYGQTAGFRAKASLRNSTIYECMVPCRGPGCNVVISAWRKPEQRYPNVESNLKVVVCEAN